MTAQPPKRATKAAAIREYLASNPSATGPEVVGALAAKGISISKPMVYIVRGKDRQKQRKAAKSTSANVATIDDNGIVANNRSRSADATKVLLRVKALAAEFGGLKIFQQYVDALAG